MDEDKVIHINHERANKLRKQQHLPNWIYEENDKRKVNVTKLGKAILI